MPFTNKDFPGQVFECIEDFEEAITKRADIEAVLEKRAATEDTEITKVTATVIPASPGLLESKVSALDTKVNNLIDMVQNLDSLQPSTTNKEGLSVGTILRGESKGESYTIEVLPGEEGYLCSNGEIYQSLSGAALGVSGNRRSGWKFWRNVENTPIGEITGRFSKNASDNPFDPRQLRTLRI